MSATLRLGVGTDRATGVQTVYDIFTGSLTHAPCHYAATLHRVVDFPKAPPAADPRFPFRCSTCQAGYVVDYLGAEGSRLTPVDSR